MVEIKEKKMCCACGACFNICPQRAIKMVEDEMGFKYPVIDKNKCTNCGLCEKKCPIINKKNNKKNTNPMALACYNKDEKIRIQSSSGGIFSLIAEYVLDNNGTVFGAGFDEKFMVKHICIQKKEDLKKLRTSKYVQSDITDMYRKAKEILESGVLVLFTGTPCQVNGLFSYLDKEYNNLYTQDIICHGVPSPKVWNKYLEYRKSKDSKEPIRINFREKTFGWKLFSLNFEYEDSKYENDNNQDLFMQAFLRDACLRESCYDCTFKDRNRYTDITLADFWGIENVLPEMDDNKGTSLMIVNTKKGEFLYNNIKDKMVYKEIEFESGIKYNHAMYMSTYKPKLRKEFFENLDNMQFDELVKKYTVNNSNLNIVQRIIRKVKKMIKNIF